MNFNNIFTPKKIKEKLNSLESENIQLIQKNEDLEKKNKIKLSLFQLKPIELEKIISEKKLAFNKENKKLENLTLEVNALDNRKKTLEENIKNLKSQIISIDEKINMESYGLYEARYSFTSSTKYKEKLNEIRKKQKEMIKNDSAAYIIEPMLLNNSKAKGRSMQRKNIKQLLRSFNIECEASINKITAVNIERIETRIRKSFNMLNKLNDPNRVKLSDEYLNRKFDELHIAFEYEQKKEEEKEVLREQREQEREEKKLQQEIAKKRKQITKDHQHFEQIQDELNKKINETTDSLEIKQLKDELEKIKKELKTLASKKLDLDYREGHATAGYVYIISNIGSFGKNIFKIGVTRRLDPIERVNELGSASVPFKFDVHALIFSENAYKLETELHERFDKNRINKVNKRKEYFDITLDEIKEVLSKYPSLTFDFHEIPEAIEYRDTQKLINKII